MSRPCPYLDAKGWHMFVGYWRPDGSAGYSCHGCGEYPGTVDTTPDPGYTEGNNETTEV
jgi:hypothetical protein